MPPRPPDESLGLDRSRLEPLREQARAALEQAIREGRPGFRPGERLSASGLARRNPIHRNTLAAALGDLVRQGYLRRLPNRGFAVADPSPGRPAQLTRHLLSLTEVAARSGLETRSALLPDLCGSRRAGALRGLLAQAPAALGLGREARVELLTRSRWMRAAGARWTQVAIEQSVFPAARLPGLLEAARRALARGEDFSTYHFLRQAFPHDEFFNALYEISLQPLPPALARHWRSAASAMAVRTVTFGSAGPLECTLAWFDPARAVLVASALDVRVT